MLADTISEGASLATVCYVGVAQPATVVASKICEGAALASVSMFGVG